MGPGLSGGERPTTTVLLLGPVEVEVAGARRRAGSPMQQALLAVLASQPGRTWTQAELVEAVWGSSAPDRAAASLHTHVWALRRLLGAEHIVRSAGGYALVLPDDACDVDQAQAAPLAASRAVADGDPERAAAVLGDALGLWRGSALAGVPGLAADAHRAELGQLRARIAEQLVELLLGLGRPDEAAARLAEVVEADPLRERSSALLVTALLAAGRRTDAQRELTRVRRALREELGLAPGAGLQRLAAQLDADGDGSRSVPRQLPARTAGFSGRAAELQQVVAAVVQGSDPGQDGALVAVTGAGGLGKTALAVQVAHQLATAFPDGQLFGAFHAHDPSGVERTAADVLPGFLRALGTESEQLPFSLDEQTTLLRSLLHGRRVLLLLDDVPGPDVVRALLPASGGCAVLVTSRRAVPGLVAREGAHEVVLQPFSTAAGVALLHGVVDRDRDDGPVASAPRQAARLVGLCGGWPLGLRLVASRLARASTADLDRAVAELVDVRTRLHRLGVPDDPQSDVRTVLQWSVDELSPGARRAYGAAGLLPEGSASAAVLAAALAVPEPDAAAALAELADHHLATATPRDVGAGFLVLHDLVRLHAQQEARTWSETVRRDGLDAMLSWYERACGAVLHAASPTTDGDDADEGRSAVLAELGVHDAGAAGRWLAERDGELRAVVRTAAAARHPAAYRLVETLRLRLFDARPLDPRQSVAELVAGWEPVVELARAGAARDGETELQSRLSTLLATFAAYGSRYDDALRLQREAAEQSPDGAHTGRLGWRLYEAGRYAEAAEQLAVAVERPQATLTARSSLSTYLADALLADGRPEEALAVAERTEALLAEHADDGALDVVAVVTNTRRLGRLHRRLGRPRPARALLTRAVELGRRESLWDELGWAALELAAVEDRLGDAPAARRWLHRALPYARTFLPFAQDELARFPELDAAVRPFVEQLARLDD
ncbi:AfsR/SARP family transcriptional regulator [Angustibacter aerolatus]